MEWRRWPGPQHAVRWRRSLRQTKWRLVRDSVDGSIRRMRRGKAMVRFGPFVFAIFLACAAVLLVALEGLQQKEATLAFESTSDPTATGNHANSSCHVRNPGKTEEFARWRCSRATRICGIEWKWNSGEKPRFHPWVHSLLVSRSVIPPGATV